MSELPISHMLNEAGGLVDDSEGFTRCCLYSRISRDPGSIYDQFLSWILRRSAQNLNKKGLALKALLHIQGRLFLSPHFDSQFDEMNFGL